MNSSNDSLAMQRITRLVDENSSLVTARSTDFNLAATDTPSDGVITGHGLIDGNLVFIYSQDASVLNGTIGEMHAKKIAAVYDMAMKMGAPVIGFIDCAGVRLQESVDALDGFGLIYAKEVAASGVVPQISDVFGSCGGGLAVVPALSDFAFIEESKGKMFVNSPETASRSATHHLRHSRQMRTAASTRREQRMRSLQTSVSWSACFRSTTREMSTQTSVRMT